MADFCEHCDGQRFDRAQILRALRGVRRDLRRRRAGKGADEALALALKTVASLELPHLAVVPVSANDDVVH